jgi:hypothetical protein
MKTLIRNILAVIIGLALGSAVNMSLIVAGPSVIPPPAGVDMTDAQSMAASIHLFGPRDFVFPFLAHALGTLAGALTAFIIAASYRHLIAYAIGAAFLAGGIMMTFTIPAPAGFIVLDLVAAYLPMAWIGTRLGGRIKTGNTVGTA